METKALFKKEWIDSKDIGFKAGIRLVHEFQKAFGGTINDMPAMLSEKDYNLRHKLMEEENEEYLEACKNGDIVGVADALGDQLYILLGTIVANGMTSIIEDVFCEIHRSNMTKLDKDGKPIVNGENGVLDEDKPIGKFLKPDTYSPADIEPIIKQLFEDKLVDKFLDDEMQEILEKKYKERDAILRSVIKEKLDEDEYKKLEEFEKLADHFASKIQMLEHRTSFDQTKFGVRIDNEVHWIDEKEQGGY
jgi:predicted HAD superfamily Cof-like phosphohydrolase